MVVKQLQNLRRIHDIASLLSLIVFTALLNLSILRLGLLANPQFKDLALKAILIILFWASLSILPLINFFSFIFPLFLYSLSACLILFSYFLFTTNALPFAFILYLVIFYSILPFIVPDYRKKGLMNSISCFFGHFYSERKFPSTFVFGLIIAAIVAHLNFILECNNNPAGFRQYILKLSTQRFILHVMLEAKRTFSVLKSVSETLLKVRLRSTFYLLLAFLSDIFWCFTLEGTALFVFSLFYSSSDGCTQIGIYFIINFVFNFFFSFKPLTLKFYFHGSKSYDCYCWGVQYPHCFFNNYLNYNTALFISFTVMLLFSDANDPHILNLYVFYQFLWKILNNESESKMETYALLATECSQSETENLMKVKELSFYIMR